MPKLSTFLILLTALSVTPMAFGSDTIATVTCDALGSYRNFQAEIFPTDDQFPESTYEARLSSSLITVQKDCRYFDITADLRIEEHRRTCTITTQLDDLEIYLRYGGELSGDFALILEWRDPLSDIGGFLGIEKNGPNPNFIYREDNLVKSADGCTYEWN